jgi:CheY-like chemotaxis protein
VTYKARSLLISEKIDPQHPAVAGYSQRYDIWHLARQRDAMAYIKTVLPKLVIVDLDMQGLEVGELVRTVRQLEQHDHAVLVGLTLNEIAVPEAVVLSFDRIIPIQG